MANPPITIGPFTNVPAPGSPIKSDWPQQITTGVCRVPQRLTGLPVMASGSYAGEVTLCTVTVPSATYPRVLIANLQYMIAMIGANTTNLAETGIRNAGFNTDARGVRFAVSSAAPANVPISVSIIQSLVPANVGGTVTAFLKQVGGGVLGGQVYSDGYFNVLDVLLLPTLVAMT